MPAKKEFQLGCFLIRYLSACLIIFGLLVAAFGLPRHALPFLALGTLGIYTTTKRFKNWLSRVRGRPTGGNPS